ncbi:Phosphoinositide phospholipase C 6 [Apostasia shenzhenica]|uniref:Phosphoinositide phospholipase C n=1 Tax=Apostasia shenzhenica TaxID=1088818 RepID=A0A2I0B4H5_9ASPA|nr:Phosphoinositide phospholipase C 6 [Apostasia shenzhenica]
MASYKYCLCFTRKFRWNDAEPPADVKAAFAAISDGGAQIGPQQLRRFLAETQRETAATDAYAERIIEQIRQQRHRQLLTKVARPLISVEDFYQYLFSDELNPPIKSQVHHDMTAPVSHYFIYTGHNSYLTGNQLSSDCSDVPIIKALQRGVRVIELDMWPNSTKDNIDILHGRTLTTPVALLKCLKSIKEYAFVASPYPVVITLEDHLTPDLQAKVAQMVTETFGDILFYPESDTIQEFPSPESLKNKIILSTKPPKEYLEAKSFKEENRSVNENVSKEEEGWGKEVPDPKTEMKSYEHEDDENEKDHDDDDADDEDDGQKRLKSSPVEYKCLITIKAGKPKGTLKDALRVDLDKVRRLSLSEHQLAKAAASHGGDLVRFTHRNILRIYPKGTRVTSTNYNPMLGWMHGAQMVALNMQGYGRSLWLMHGFYRANGGCGYVKKPHFLLQEGPHGEVFNPEADLPVKKTLKVKVYLGDGWRIDFKHTHFDAYSPPDFYTKVGIAGVPGDTVMKKTKIIEDNWVPVWDEEFTFPLRIPELALLRVEVHEYDMSEKDDFGGQTCLPVSELRPGIRAVPLYDRKGEKYKSVRLLMRFEFV